MGDMVITVARDMHAFSICAVCFRNTLVPSKEGGKRHRTIEGLSVHQGIVRFKSTTSVSGVRGPPERRKFRCRRQAGDGILSPSTVDVL